MAKNNDFKINFSLATLYVNITYFRKTPASKFASDRSGKVGLPIDKMFNNNIIVR